MSGSSAKDMRWWLDGEGQKHTKVLEAVRGIRANQAQQRLQDLLHGSLYDNTPAALLGGSLVTRRMSTGRLSLNVVRNMVSAVTSKIASKNKPKPTFLTEEGNYEQREKAEKLEKFVSGVFYESKVYPTITKCFRDACVYGTGILKVYETDKQVECVRVRQPDLLVDDEEARDADPRNMYEEYWYDALVAKDRWAKDNDELAAAIERARAQRKDDDFDISPISQGAHRIRITEAFHLGESDDTPGRHVICIDGATLLDEEWKGPFPYAFMRWSEPLEGFFGTGLAEELLGVQAEINKLLQQIQRGHHLIAGHYLVDASASVPTAQINNDLAAIVKYKGIKPEYVAPQIISPEVYNHLWQLYAKAFEIAGISQLNATGQKPAGLDSGAAQRAYQDTQTERFLEVGQSFEEFVVEAARQVVRCAKRKGGSYKVRAEGKGAISFVDWKDIDIDEDLYVIRVYPTSMLPTTPAGRLAWAQDMINSGVLPPEDVLDVVDFPDTEAYAKRRNAPRRVIERNISHMIRTGEFMSPEPFDNHKLALRLVNEAYHEARIDGVPEDRLELLRRYMADTQDFLGQEMPPPVPPMMPPGMPGDPMGAPPPGMPPAMPPGPPMPAGPPMAPPMAA